MLRKKSSNQTIIEGAPSADWWAKQAISTADNFKKQVRIGMMRGEGTVPPDELGVGVDADGAGPGDRGGECRNQ